MIATGTPGGVGDSRTPPRYLREGDTVEIYVGGVGTLSNPVRNERVVLTRRECRRALDRLGDVAAGQRLGPPAVAGLNRLEDRLVLVGVEPHPLRRLGLRLVDRLADPRHPQPLGELVQERGCPRPPPSARWKSRLASKLAPDVAHRAPLARQRGAHPRERLGRPACRGQPRGAGLDHQPRLVGRAHARRGRGRRRARRGWSASRRAPRRRAGAAPRAPACARRRAPRRGPPGERARRAAALPLEIRSRIAA